MPISEGSLPIALPGGNPAAKIGPAEYDLPAPEVKRKRYHQKGKPPQLAKLPAFKQDKKAFAP